jgi:hypothetical protein
MASDDQEYYWSEDWQRDEQIAVDELARGEGIRFLNGAAASEWLRSADRAGSAEDRDVPEHRAR